MSYTNLTLKQRFQLEIYSEKAVTLAEISLSSGIPESTVCREFLRAGGREGYDARKADALARKRRTNGKRETKKLLSDTEIASYVEEKITLFWSPEQIAGRMRTDIERTICHETIYSFIYEEKMEWKKYLRHKKGKYRRRRGTKERERKREEAKKQRIDTRPGVIDRRERLGDWEGDTIVGGEKTTGILTHVDRRSGYLLGDLFLKKSAVLIREKTVKRFLPVPGEKKYSITYDNGIEFSDHERMAALSGIDVFFAYPYHSWERGTNENTNGLLRQFFPKRMKLATLRQKDVDWAVDLINHRPRKRLGYLTPHEVFVEGKAIALQARM